MGRWCFRRRWWVIAAWLAVFLFGLTLPGRLFAGLVDDPTPKNVESTIGQDRLERGLDTSGQVIGLVDRLDPEGAGVRDAVLRAAEELARRRDVNQVQTPYGAARPTPVPLDGKDYLSRDGRALLVVVTLARLDPLPRNEEVTAVRQRLDRLVVELHDAGQFEARVRVGGDPAIDHDLQRSVHEDLGRGEAVALPVTLAVLVVVFGGLAAAALPLGAAVVSVGAAMIMLLGFSAVTELNPNMVSIVTILGLGLSIDYGLLLVGRYREELLAGHPPEEAVGRTWATAGRTIMFSALTVAAALSGALVFDITVLSATGAAGVSIAVVAMGVSLTLTAALLGVAGRRIRPARRAGHSKRARHEGVPGAFFARLAGIVQQRAAAATAVAAGALLVAGAPLLASDLRLPGLSELPRSITSVQVADELDRRFGRPPVPAVTVVAQTDPATLARWAARFGEDPAVTQVGLARPAGDGLAVVELFVAGDAQSDAAQALVRRLRADRPPASSSWVTGEAAALIDVTAVVGDALPRAVGVTVLAMAVLLFAMTGSVVVPVKAIVANVLSLSATFGIMSLIFERGLFAAPLATVTVAGFEPFIVVLICALAFALAMDYEVFLLGRIKEHVDAGLDNDAAVRQGLQRTGRVITSAALLMVIVFGGLGAARVSGLEQLGIGLAIAVLIDATVVRCVLIPASMTLMGRWNWWAPAPLTRLYERFGLREHHRPAPRPVREPLAIASAPAPTPAEAAPVDTAPPLDATPLDATPLDATPLDAPPDAAGAADGTDRTIAVAQARRAPRKRLRATQGTARDLYRSRVSALRGDDRGSLRTGRP